MIKQLEGENMSGLEIRNTLLDARNQFQSEKSAEDPYGLHKKERSWELTDCPVIIVSGPPGSGTTTASEVLAKKVGLRKNQIIKVGDKRRREYREQTGYEIFAGVDRDPIVDKETDNTTAEIIRRATTSKPVIIEGQLAGWIAKQVQDYVRNLDGRELQMARFQLSADEMVRARRVYNRLKQEDPEKHKDLTLEEVLEGNRDRYNRDLVAWEAAHPALHGINPHSHDSMDRDRHPIYDLAIDTTFMPQEVVLASLILHLADNRKIQPYHPTQTDRKINI